MTKLPNQLWTPVLAAVVVLSCGIALSRTDIGPAPGPYKGSEAPNTEVTVTGLIVHRKLAGDGRAMITIETPETLQLAIYIADDAHAPTAVVGQRVSVRATIIGPRFLTAVKPKAVTLLLPEPELRQVQARVRSHWAHVHGTSNTNPIPAPGLADGTYLGQVATTEQGTVFSVD